MQIAIPSEMFPASAYGIAAEVVGTKIYLFGGFASASAELSTINVFNAETCTIETLGMALLGKCGVIAAAAVGGEVYLFGGSTGSSDTDLIINFWFRFL